MTDDLRDRLTEALRGAAHNCDDDCTRDDHTYLPLDQGDPERRWTINTTTGEILDAVMAVIESLPNRGYCEHCGRGDCTPTAAQWDQERQRAERAEAAIERVRLLCEQWQAVMRSDESHPAEGGVMGDDFQAELRKLLASLPKKDIPFESLTPEIYGRLCRSLDNLRSELAKADAENRAAGKRAEQAEAQIAEVRRLQNMTIAASCRAHAIEQAEDTLAALERASKAALDQPRKHA